MQIALAQLNPTIGDLSGNVEKVAEAAARARACGAALLVTSELVVSGYPPKDLLHRAGFVSACDRAVDTLAKRIDPQLGLVVGHPTTRGVPGGQIANAVSLVAGGTVHTTHHKYLLPNYDVFDEQRYFREAEDVTPIEFGGLRLGVHICEDAWWGVPQTFYHQDPRRRHNPMDRLAAQGIDLFINLSASPFEITKPKRRLGILRPHPVAHGKPLIFVNQVGGNDDLVFDGHSLVLAETGELLQLMAGFEEDFRIVDTDSLGDPIPDPDPPRESLLFDALTLGLSDYMRKCGFTDCVLGLSGGIDSALTVAVAAHAVGPEHVHALLMPSRYSTGHSVEDARSLAENLGIDWEVVPIDAVHAAYEQTRVIGEDLTSQPAGPPRGVCTERSLLPSIDPQRSKCSEQADRAGLADQNLQARIRGAMVMVRSNRHGWMALATGNKSELAVGYCTLYGDMAGGFAVLCDLFKRDVYAVARHVNALAGEPVIPEHIIDKPPSAELAPNQFDQDALPPYPLLDDILEGLIEHDESVETLSQRFPPETVRWVATRLDRNEFKRRQMPPGIKLSPRAFGSGRRMPMAARIVLEPCASRPD